jgi:hypothetical protein
MSFENLEIWRGDVGEKERKITRTRAGLSKEGIDKDVPTSYNSEYKIL